MLSVQNVTKYYGKVKANDDISFSVEDGQIAVLLGPNGAGKSTIIKCIAGLLRFKGEITINGHPNRSLEAKSALGYVPETPAAYDMLTVAEHLEFVRRANRLEDDGLADRLLERFDLSNLSDKLGKELSKGMQQKLSICCALAHRPEIIVFDEPLVGLDPRASHQLKENMREHRDRGNTVFFSTHVLEVAERLCDRIAIIDAGRLVAVGSVAELKARFESGSAGTSLESIFLSLTELDGGEKNG